MKKQSEDKNHRHGFHGGNEKKKSPSALAKSLQRKATHPYWGSVEYHRCLHGFQSGPASDHAQPTRRQPGRWAKILLLLLSLFATLWLGWAALSLSTSAFAAHLQAVWRELNAN